MSLTATIIVNPTSGGFRPQLGEEIAVMLKGRGYVSSVLHTTAPGDATAMAQQAVAQRDSLLVVCGGDGTIGEVLNGVGAASVTIAVVPAGTANVLAYEIGIGDSKAAMAALQGGAAHTLALGCATTTDTQRRFALMAGVGFDGRVVAAVRATEKRRFGKGAYLLAALRCLWHWESPRLNVTLDEQTVVCHGIIVCNAKHYGGAFCLAAEADPFSPGFQTVCIHGPRRRDYLRLALAVLTGRVAQARGISVIAANRVKIDGTASVQLDGDPWLATPAVFTAEAGALRIIVPADPSVQESPAAKSNLAEQP